MRFSLLSSNTKLEKMNGRKYSIVGLSLAPHSSGGFGNVCESATHGCISSCVLRFAGRTLMDSVRNAQKRRTQLLFTDRSEFNQQLWTDLAKHEAISKRNRLIPLVRLNVASDLDWTDTIDQFPGIRFYDYTKVRSRILGALPDNYSLTYSWNENSRHNTAGAVLARGRNVAMVFDTPYDGAHKVYGPLPNRYRLNGEYRSVIDGDKHDIRLRETDGTGVIVGLRLKGTNKARARAIASGFARPIGVKA